jgi:hypothetical protein
VTARCGTPLATLPIMRKLTGIAARIALIGAMTSGIVAACYDRVPGPSGPLPPTKEAKPFGSKPKRIKPEIVNPKFGAADETPEPAHDVADAGVADVLDLPPVPDASVPLDAPGIKK